MAITGNTYTVNLKEAHLGWGNHRHTSSRGIINGEGYIPIPSQHAKNFCVYNSNNVTTGLGYNLFLATSSDGYFANARMLAQGCSTAGNPYAKQFSIQGDLTLVGAWFTRQGATTSNSVRVTWTSPTEIYLEIL